MNAASPLEICLYVSISFAVAFIGFISFSLLILSINLRVSIEFSSFSVLSSLNTLPSLKYVNHIKAVVVPSPAFSGNV